MSMRKRRRLMFAAARRHGLVFEVFFDVDAAKIDRFFADLMGKIAKGYMLPVDALNPLPPHLRWPDLRCRVVSTGCRGLPAGS